jgi:hypothetical protein
MVMLTRSRVEDVRQHTSRLLYDPDPAVSRLAAHWHRYPNDQAFANAELTGIEKSKLSDHYFVLYVVKFWRLSSSADRQVVTALRRQVRRYSRSRSAKVRWHLRALETRTAWIDTAP